MRNNGFSILFTLIIIASFNDSHAMLRRTMLRRNCVPGLCSKHAESKDCSMCSEKKIFFAVIVLPISVIMLWESYRMRRSISKFCDVYVEHLKDEQKSKEHKQKLTEYAQEQKPSSW